MLHPGAVRLQLRSILLEFCVSDCPCLSALASLLDAAASNDHHEDKSNTCCASTDTNFRGLREGHEFFDCTVRFEELRRILGGTTVTGLVWGNEQGSRDGGGGGPGGF